MWRFASLLILIGVVAFIVITEKPDIVAFANAAGHPEVGIPSSAKHVAVSHSAADSDTHAATKKYLPSLNWERDQVQVNNGKFTGWDAGIIHWKLSFGVALRITRSMVEELNAEAGIDSISRVLTRILDFDMQAGRLLIEQIPHLAGANENVGFQLALCSHPGDDSLPQSRASEHSGSNGEPLGKKSELASVFGDLPIYCNFAIAVCAAVFWCIGFTLIEDGGRLLLGGLVVICGFGIWFTDASMVLDGSFLGWLRWFF